MSALTRLPFDWTIDRSYRARCSPIATCFAASWKCRRSKSPIVIDLPVACTCVTIDLRICTVRPIGRFDLCIRNVHPTNLRDQSKWSSIRFRCAENVADTLRTFVWCGLVWHLRASLTLTLKQNNNKKNNQKINRARNGSRQCRKNSPKIAQINSCFSIIFSDLARRWIFFSLPFSFRLMVFSPRN